VYNTKIFFCGALLTLNKRNHVLINR